MITKTTSDIHEEVLRDPRFPVHKIADKLLPYLDVLVENFRPQRVILFGSWAYGEPHSNSDVDLLVVQEHTGSSLHERIRIRQVWWEMPRKDILLPFDLIVVSPNRHRERLETAAGFYDNIVERGLVLV